MVTESNAELYLAGHFRQCNPEGRVFSVSAAPEEAVTSVFVIPVRVVVGCARIVVMVVAIIVAPLDLA